MFTNPGRIIEKQCSITIDGTFKKNKEGFVNIALHALGFGVHQDSAGGKEYSISTINLLHAYVPSEQAVHALFLFDLLRSCATQFLLAGADSSTSYLKSKIRHVVIDGRCFQ